MANFHHDQAEGLRRLLAGQRPRNFTFLATVQGVEKRAMLDNLCTSLVLAGSETVLLHAGDVMGAGARQHAAIEDVACGRRPLDEALHEARGGYRAARLWAADRSAPKPDTGRLRETLHAVSADADIVITDVALDADAMARDFLWESDILVQATPDPASIKWAYGMIKRLNAEMGRQRINLLVTGATEQQGATVHANIAAAASRYLASSVDFLGSVPPDRYLTRAADLGRAVTDAFPMANASVAFRRLAQRFALSDTRSGAHSGT
ncbi:MAG: MinD/ParA family ATP-binding protein [Burkholderiaceae bacterium]